MFIHEQDLERLVQSIVQDINNLDFKEFEEFINDVEDVQYKADKFGRYIGGTIFLMKDDPTIQIDTDTGYMLGSWGISRESKLLNDQTVKLIDFFLHHNYNRLVRLRSA